MHCDSNKIAAAAPRRSLFRVASTWAPSRDLTEKDSRGIGHCSAEALLCSLSKRRVALTQEGGRVQRRRPFEEEVPRFFVSARVRRAPAQEGLLVRCVHGRSRFTQMSPVTNDRDFVFDWDACSEGSFGARVTRMRRNRY